MIWVGVDFGEKSDFARGGELRRRLGIGVTGSSSSSSSSNGAGVVEDDFHGSRLKLFFRRVGKFLATVRRGDAGRGADLE